MVPATLQSLGEENPLDSTMGAMLIGIILSAVLFGITLVQTLFYFNWYPKDRWPTKALVGLVMLLDTIHMVMISHTAYHYLITNYYDRAALNKMTWSVLAESLPTGITGAVVQAFYAWRVWHLSQKNILLTLPIAVLIITTAGCGTAWVVLSLLRTTFTQLLEITGLTIAINALSATVDLILAASLCFLLHQARSGLKDSDTMINTLILFVVNTGLLTSLCAIGALVSLVASSNTLIYALFYFCIGRLYSNSLLASLNARRIVRGQIQDEHMMVSMSGSRQFENSHLTSHETSKSKIAIHVDTTQTQTLEDDFLKTSGGIPRFSVGPQARIDTKYPHTE